MSTVAEIKAAISHFPAGNKAALGAVI